MVEYKMNNAEIDLCIEQISKSDRDALRKLYDEFKTPIFRFALSILKDYKSAEDVMQDTFINIMQYCTSYKQGTNPKAWIFSISRNLCMQELKKHINMIDIDNLEQQLTTSEPYYSIANRVDSIESLTVLEPALLEVVTLFVYGGLKQTEIAKVLGISYIKVRSRYGYAMKKLKAHYSERTENYEKQRNSQKT